MKKTYASIAALALGFLLAGSLSAQTVHQTLKGEAAFGPSGGSAVKENLIEVKEIPEHGKVARVVGSAPVWGYVNYWFGIPAPEGHTVLKVDLYFDGNETAPFAFYIKREGGEPVVKKLEIPADAKKDSIVTVEIPIDFDHEWNGVSMKKIAASDKPGPWIQNISVVRP